MHDNVNDIDTEHTPLNEAERINVDLHVPRMVKVEVPTVVEVFMVVHQWKRPTRWIFQVQLLQVRQRHDNDDDVVKGEENRAEVMTVIGLVIRIIVIG
jgi:hypothetical protein